MTYAQCGHELPFWSALAEMLNQLQGRTVDEGQVEFRIVG